MSTTTETDRLADAAEALRRHLHERPFDDEPNLVYFALSDLTDTLHRAAEVLGRAKEATDRASQADDDNLDQHVIDARVRLERARQAALSAAGHLRLAHNASGHLIWDADR